MARIYTITPKIEHKQGATFRYVGSIDEPAIDDFAGWTAESQLKDSSGILVSDIEFSWIDTAMKTFQLYVPTSTNNWPIGTHEYDIWFTTPAGDLVPTKENGQVRVFKGVTVL